MNHAHEATRASLILRLQNAEDVGAWDEFIAIYLDSAILNAGSLPETENVVSAMALNLCNATGLPGGSLRWLLPSPGCQNSLSNTTGLPGGSLSFQPRRIGRAGRRLESTQRKYPRGKPVALGLSGSLFVAASVTIHGASPWHLQFGRPDQAAKVALLI